MNIVPPAMSRHQPNAPSPVVVVVFPNDLVHEILLLLAVKPLTRLKSVSKSWNTLISNPTFVKMHLEISSRNPHLILTWNPTAAISVVPFPVCRLLENPHQSITTLVNDPRCRLNDKGYCQVIGSCNGLVCLLGRHSLTLPYGKMWLRLWNPSTRTMSKQLGSFRHPPEHSREYICCPCRFAFGYDNSMEIYKVVAFHVDSYKDQDEGLWRHRNTVNILSLGGDNDNNNWRNIQSFPLVPLQCSFFAEHNEGVHLTGTINWLAFCNNLSYNYDFRFSDLNSEDTSTVEKLVIVSLDLSSETYTELLLPQGFSDFSEMPRVEPVIGVLMDCLCFSHDFKKTHFVIWQMKEFGVADSWTQLLKVSYVQDLQIIGDIHGDFDYPFRRQNLSAFPWLPLYLSKNGDTLLLANDGRKDAILYNWRHNTVERTRLTSKILWSFTKDYVESLVSVF